MKIYDMNRPALPFSGMEMIPCMQGSQDASIPLFAARDLPQGDVLVMRHKYLADLGSTTDSDPGTGKLRWNNVAPDSADTLFVSDTDTEANADMGDTLQYDVGVGGRIYIQGCADTEARGNWQVWEIAEQGVAGTAYSSVSVMMVASQGAFADDDPIEVSVVNPSPGAEMPVLRDGIVSGSPTSSNTMNLNYGYISDNFVTTLNEDITTWTIEEMPAGGANGTKIHFTMLFTQGSTPWSITWPSQFNWCGQTPPTMPTAPGSQLFVELDSFDGGSTFIARAYLLD